MRTPTRIGKSSLINPSRDNTYGILIAALTLLSSIPLFSINMLIMSIWLPITNELIGIFMAISLVEGLVYVSIFSDILTNGFGGSCP